MARHRAVMLKRDELTCDKMALPYRESKRKQKKVEHMKWKLQHTNVISAQLASASQLRSYEEMNYPSLNVKTCATTSTSLTTEQVQTHFMFSIT